MVNKQETKNYYVHGFDKSFIDNIMSLSKYVEDRCVDRMASSVLGASYIDKNNTCDYWKPQNIAQEQVVAIYGLSSMGFLVEPVCPKRTQTIAVIDYNSIPRINTMALELKVDNIDGNAKSFLLKDMTLLGITDDIVDLIIDILDENYLEGKRAINIKLQNDEEVPDFKEIVISVLVRESKYENIIRLMDTIGEVVDKLKKMPLNIHMKEYVDKYISITVDELENV